MVVFNPNHTHPLCTAHDSLNTLDQDVHAVKSTDRLNDLSSSNTTDDLSSSHDADTIELQSKRLFEEFMQLSCQLPAGSMNLNVPQHTAVTHASLEASLPLMSAINDPTNQYRVRMDSGFHGMDNDYSQYYSSTRPTILSGQPAMDLMNCPPFLSFETGTSSKDGHLSSLRSRRPAVPDDLSIAITSTPDPCGDSPYSSSTSSATLVSDFIQGVMKQNAMQGAYDFAIDPNLTLIDHQKGSPMLKGNGNEHAMQDKSPFVESISDISSSIQSSSPCFGNCDSPLAVESLSTPLSLGGKTSCTSHMSSDKSDCASSKSTSNILTHSFAENPSHSLGLMTSFHLGQYPHESDKRNLCLHSPAALGLSDIVQEYLNKPRNEYTLVMNQPKVAQKSYGGEKRFICPPPLCYVFGDGWGIPSEPQFPANRQSPYDSRWEPSASPLPDTLFSPVHAEIRLSDEDPTGAHMTKKQKHDRIDARKDVRYHKEVERSFASPWSSTSRTSKKTHYYDVDSEGSEFMDVDDDKRDPSYGTKSRWRDRKRTNFAAGFNTNKSVSSIHMLELARVDGLSGTCSIRDQVCYSLNGLSRTPRFVMPALFKGLHVSDGDVFPLFVDIFNAENRHLITFESSPMRVISKPSKSCKKELMIHSGSTIALFNRVRAQTGSTKFLSVSADGSHFVPRTTSWDNFVIWHVDDRSFNPWHPFKASQVPLLIARMASVRSTHQVAQAWAQKEIDTLTLKLGNDHHAKDQHGLVWTRPAPLAIPKVEAQQHIQPISVIQMMEEHFGLHASHMKASYDDHLASRSDNIESNYNYHGRPRSSSTSQHPGLATKETPIFYGDTIVLQNVNTGLVSKPMIIRNVPKTTLAAVEDPTESRGMSKNVGLIPERDPVSQLHKVAFEMQGNPGCYLSISQTDDDGLCAQYATRARSKSGSKKVKKGKQVVGKRRRDSDCSEDEVHGGDSKEKESHVDNVGELGVWTIVGTVRNEVTFHVPNQMVNGFHEVGGNGNQSLSKIERLRKIDVHPIPKVTLIKQHAPHWVAFFGENFDSNRHVVFFGPYAAKRIEFKGNGVLLVETPQLPSHEMREKGQGSAASHTCSEYGMNEIDMDVNLERLTVPILIARQDGVIYRTGQYYKLQ